MWLCLMFAGFGKSGTFSYDPLFGVSCESADGMSLMVGSVCCGTSHGVVDVNSELLVGGTLATATVLAFLLSGSVKERIL